MTEPTGVTVVVPTLNRGGFLYDCLSDLIAQAHRPLEILVVDQSQTTPDQVKELVLAHPELISYHTVTFRGLPQARNYGWQRARYEAIVFVDDDIRCSPNLVEEHLRSLTLPNVGVAAGSITESGRPAQPAKRAGRFRYWKAEPERVFSQPGEYDVDHVPGCNFATWRHISEIVGGFDERLNVGAALYEETEFCLRVKKAGYRIYYNSQAHLVHLVGATGGCRVDEIEAYVWALAHNRTILIQRHLNLLQQPVAFVELLRLGFAYAVRYRQVKALRALIAGSVTAMRESGIRTKVMRDKYARL